MSAYVLLSLLSKMRERDKMRGDARLAKHLYLFHNEFNKYKNTGGQILDSIYHMALKLLTKSHVLAYGSQWLRGRGTGDRRAAGSSLTSVTVLCP